MRMSYDVILKINYVFQVAGWGLTEKQEVSNELRTLNLPVIERSVCLKELQQYHYTGFLTSDKFCAGLLNGLYNILEVFMSRIS